MDYDRLRELQEKFEENPRRYFAPLANEYRKGGQPKRAIEICRAQLAQMPGHMSGQIVYGQALYEASEFAEAREVFERALALDPENLIALRTLGDMSLQSGNTAEARSWYTRLLDADPKDTAVIALVQEIDNAADAVTPVPEEIPGVDTDAGDQAIPFITDALGGPVGEGPTPEPTAAASSASGTPAAAAASTAQPEVQRDVSPSAREDSGGTESIEAGRESVAETHAGTASGAETQAAPRAESVSEAAPPEGLERHYPVEPPSPPAPPTPEPDFEIGLGAEGLHSRVESTGKIGAEDLRSLAKTPVQPMGTEGLRGTEPAEKIPEGTEGLKGTPPPAPLAGAKGARSDDEAALDAWTPPPGATVHERKEARKEDRMFSGPAPEPFVNETMAQLYLQQGYRQLALKVYRQLAETRPGDQALKDRIAQIEAEDRAAHPEQQPAPAARPERVPQAAARPEPPAPSRAETPPRAEAPPQAEAPPRAEPAPQRAEGAPRGESAPRVDATARPEPAPRAEPLRREPPARAEPTVRPEPAPRAEPAARRQPEPVEAPQPEPELPRSPSIETPTPGPGRESEESPRFDRTPIDSPPPEPQRAPSRERESIEAPAREEPRAEPEGIAARQPSIREFFATLGRRKPPRAATHSSVSAPPPPSLRASSGATSDSTVPMGGAPTSASLDAVFAGATVNPADSRAASRLAGAFSGTAGASRTTPPTPPMPTPRVNPRVPAAQESEEDVAKFRAWLDGLTGE